MMAHNKHPKRNFETKYYDIEYLEKVLKFSETDPFFTIDMLEEYINLYPKDYIALSSYLSLLITVGRFEDSKKILLLLENTLKYGKKYSSNNTKYQKKIENIREKIYYNKLRLLLYTEKYKEAYDYMVLNENALKNVINNIYIIKLFCREKLGMHIKSKEIEKNNFYSTMQIVNYSEESFLEHISNHLESKRSGDCCNGEAYFYENFPFDEIFLEIKQYIPNDNRLHRGFIDDIYFFKYDSCGKTYGKDVDYFKIIVSMNSKEFITMYPVGNEFKNIPYVDLNYLRKEEQPLSRTKKLSQIDKFNQRYGNCKK